LAENDTGTSPAPVDDGFLRRMEEAAAEVSAKAGALVLERFGGAIEVSTKDEAGRDLVTDVDHASQSLIKEFLAAEFPDHMFLGEEDSPEDEAPAGDFVWAVDPVDGTINYASGLPLHSVSVAALYRGAPIAGAVWLPWPSADGACSRVVHARRGGGTWLDGRRLRIEAPKGDGAPTNGRVSTVPTRLPWMYEIGKPLRRSPGEQRGLAGASYETVLVAAGNAEYAVLGPARTWDFAAGTLLVTEAGGAAVSLEGRHWTPLDSFAPDYSNTPETTRRLRAWRRAVIMGAPATVMFVSSNLRPRRPSLRARLRRGTRRLTGRRA